MGGHNMKVSLQSVTHSLSKKFLIPTTVAAATLLSSASAKAQTPKTDTLEIAKKELYSEPTGKGTKLIDISIGIAFLLGMGAMAASKYISGDNDKNS